MSDTDLQIIDKQSADVQVAEANGISSLGDVMNTQQLRAAIKAAESQRKLIKEFVRNQLVDGTDYGVIIGNKPSLLKPGQEKIFSLFKLTSRLERDDETLAMLGNESGTVAYLCRVYKGGEEITQGRGVAVVGDKKRDANSTVKIAEKRARMDACLSLGFSEFFTQDLEEPEYQDGETTGPDGEVMASDKQKLFISQMLGQLGITLETQRGHLNERYGVDTPLTAEAAEFVIKELKDELKLTPNRTI